MRRTVLKFSVKLSLLITIFFYINVFAESYHNVQKRSLLFFNATKDTKFLLKTFRNKEIFQEIFLNNVTSLKSSNFDPKDATRFVIHGWLNTKNSPINIIVPEAYLTVGNFNVFTVDWSEGGNNILYTNIVQNRVPDVGKIVAKFIDFLYEVTGVDFLRIYLIGHSLGAHVAGYAGKNVKNGNISVIFGLDAAGPLYENKPADSRLASTDANYVEVIHTSAKTYGYVAAIGDTDFYPNYGVNQPGCSVNALCSHNRSYSLFAESIYTSVGFWSRSCESYEEIINDSTCTGGIAALDVLMGGEPARINRSGIFYLPTNAEQPYAKGRF